MATHILLIHGPNLNLLGTREPDVYGATTLSEIECSTRLQVELAGGRFNHFQSNHEGALIDRIHAAKTEKVDAILINPGGLTHTSITLRDALLSVAIPFVEIHLTNIYRREPFRHHSYLSDIASGIICGLGIHGYPAAVDFALKNL